MVNKDFEEMLDILEQVVEKLKTIEKKEFIKIWEFTETDKTILRSLHEEYKWIGRDSEGTLTVFIDKPVRCDEYGYDHWRCRGADFYELSCFPNICKSIKWEDEEPCDFRRFI